MFNGNAQSARDGKTSTSLLNVSGHRYRVVRAETNKQDLIDAFQLIKSNLPLIENALERATGAQKKEYEYILALGRILVALVLREKEP